jgi:NRAMP (natural resistance-associated macrophage protein)-like metal ion transporter
MMTFFTKFRRFLKILGPGLITGAADDDPSGIATYTQTGAQFGLNQLWTVFFAYPLMTAVQEACARIGAVTGKGLAAVIKQNYRREILYGVVILVVVANTINIGADIGAMASSMQLVVPIHFTFWTVAFTAAVLALEIFTSYKVYAKILKWLTLFLLSYLLTIFIVTNSWQEVFWATFIPHIEFNFGFLFIITGVLGTTISPYMFFWEASEEVEEEKEKKLFRRGKPTIDVNFVRNLRIDNVVGMAASQVTAWAIIVVAATVLNKNGITDITTVADAAKALEPLVATFPNSGFLAKGLFALGVVGLGLLSVPVLSGSASYAVSEAFNWKEGLNLKLKKAHGFYGVITIATVVGLLINYVGVDPVRALIFAAVINGIGSVPLLFLITKISSSKNIMGKYSNGSLSNALLWLTFSVMAVSVLAMFFVVIFHY